jgi:hypothetical protein
VRSGRIPVRAEPDGWRLVPDPAYASLVAGLVRRYLAGGSFRMPSRWLSAEGIPAPSGSGLPVPEARRGRVILVVMLGYIPLPARCGQSTPGGASGTWQMVRRLRRGGDGGAAAGRVKL